MNPNSLANLRTNARACKLHPLEPAGKQRRCRTCRRAYDRQWHADRRRLRKRQAIPGVERKPGEAGPDRIVPAGPPTFSENPCVLSDAPA